MFLVIVDLNINIIEKADSQIRAPEMLFIWMMDDLWVYVLSTVFKPYKENGRVIMKDHV